jgi:orotate phosphoribosyltransferase
MAFLHNRPVDGKVYIDDVVKGRMDAYLAEYGAE